MAKRTIRPGVARLLDNGIVDTTPWCVGCGHRLRDPEADEGDLCPACQEDEEDAAAGTEPSGAHQDNEAGARHISRRYANWRARVDQLLRSRYAAWLRFTGRG